MDDPILGKTFVAAMGEAFNLLKLMSRLQVAVMDHMRKTAEQVVIDLPTHFVLRF